MNKYFLVSAFCAVSLTAAAQTLPAIDTVTINAGQLTLQGKVNTVFMDNADFYRFIRAYDLSNGRTLSLYTRGLTKYAAIDGDARHEIHATSGNSFIADDRKLAIQINFNAKGEASGYAIMASDSKTMAGSVTINPETILAFK